MKKLYLFLVFIIFSSPILLAQIYVTETGAGSKDGSSWTNAYESTQLQQAINEAETAPVKQVWVAKGTYKPTEKLSETIYTTATGTTIGPSLDRDVAFILKAGVEIYGGFAGTETSINDRTFPDIFSDLKEPAVPYAANPNETILSGDLNNNNTSDIGDAYHVVSARDDADGAVLDGFTIRHGNGDSGSSYAEIDGSVRIRRSIGSGISFSSAKTLTFKNLVVMDNYTSNAGAAVSSTPTHSDARFHFINVRFEGNESAGNGGTIYSLVDAGASQLNITECVFLNGKSGGGTGGGAIYFTGDSNDAILNINNSHFEGNEVTGTGHGGALRLLTGTTNIVNSKFKGNKAVARGGAMYISNGTINADGCTFEQNTAASTGGVIHVASGNTVFNVSKCDFFSNESATSGGVIYTTSDVNITKSRFYHNTATNQGGVFYIFTSSTSNSNVNVDNSLFYNNTANGVGTTTHGGGAVYISRSASGELSTLTATNNTFYANKSPNSPHGAISFNHIANVTINLYNNIFNGNTGSDGPSDIRKHTGATQTYSYNLFQDAIVSGSNRTVVMPYYLDGTNPQPLFASTTEGDYNFLWPTEDSFAIGKGDNVLYTNNVSDVATAKDFLGNDRLEGTTIDLGAIEWGVVLPVQVSSFTANLVNGRTRLTWNVGTEDNVNRYEVERSQDGSSFVKVAEVAANGSSSYGTADNNPETGVNYYRLVTIDNDGARKAYDRVQTVTVATLASEGVGIYPNPATGSEVNVSLGNAAAGSYGYKVVSVTGSVVQQGTLSYDGKSAVVSVGSLPAGVYVLQFSNGAQAKLIKQ